MPVTPTAPTVRTRQSNRSKMTPLQQEQMHEQIRKDEKKQYDDKRAERKKKTKDSKKIAEETKKQTEAQTKRELEAHTKRELEAVKEAQYQINEAEAVKNKEETKKTAEAARQRSKEMGQATETKKKTHEATQAAQKATDASAPHAADTPEQQRANATAQQQRADEELKNEKAARVEMDVYLQAHEDAWTAEREAAKAVLAVETVRDTRKSERIQSKHAAKLDKTKQEQDKVETARKLTAAQTERDAADQRKYRSNEKSKKEMNAYIALLKKTKEYDDGEKQKSQRAVMEKKNVARIQKQNEANKRLLETDPKPENTDNAAEHVPAEESVAEKTRKEEQRNDIKRTEAKHANLKAVMNIDWATTKKNIMAGPDDRGNSDQYSMAVIAARRHTQAAYVMCEDGLVVQKELNSFHSDNIGEQKTVLGHTIAKWRGEDRRALTAYLIAVGAQLDYNAGSTPDPDAGRDVLSIPLIMLIRAHNRSDAGRTHWRSWQRLPVESAHDAGQYTGEYAPGKASELAGQIAALVVEKVDNNAHVYGDNSVFEIEFDDEMLRAEDRWWYRVDSVRVHEDIYIPVDTITLADFRRLRPFEEVRRRSTLRANKNDSGMNWGMARVTVDGHTLLHLAVLHALPALVIEELVASCPGALSAQLSSGETPLQVATGLPYVDAATIRALGRRAEIHVGYGRKTPLHEVAAFSGDCDVIRAVMEIDDSMKYGWGARLVEFVGETSGHVQMLSVCDLLDANSSLFGQKTGGGEEMAAILQLNRALSVTSYRGVYATPTTVAMNPSSTTLRAHMLGSVAQLETAVCANPTAVSAVHADGGIALHHAAGNPDVSIEVVKYLVDIYKAGCYVKDRYGRLPIHCACALKKELDERLPAAKRQGQVMHILYAEYRESSKVEDDGGRTPLLRDTSLRVKKATKDITPPFMPIETLIRTLDLKELKTRIHEIKPDILCADGICRSPLEIATTVPPEASANILDRFTRQSQLDQTRAAQKKATLKSTHAVFKFLLDLNKSACIVADAAGKTPLHHAFERGFDSEAAEIMYSCFGTHACGMKCASGMYPLHYALQNRRRMLPTVVITELFRIHPDAMHKRDVEGRYPINYVYPRDDQCEDPEEDVVGVTTLLLIAPETARCVHLPADAPSGVDNTLAAAIVKNVCEEIDRGYNTSDAFAQVFCAVLDSMSENTQELVDIMLRLHPHFVWGVITTDDGHKILPALYVSSVPDNLFDGKRWQLVPTTDTTLIKLFETSAGFEVDPAILMARITQIRNEESVYTGRTWWSRSRLNAPLDNRLDEMLNGKQQVEDAEAQKMAYFPEIVDLLDGIELAQFLCDTPNARFRPRHAHYIKVASSNATAEQFRYYIPRVDSGLPEESLSNRRSMTTRIESTMQDNPVEGRTEEIKAQIAAVGMRRTAEVVVKSKYTENDWIEKSAPRTAETIKICRAMSRYPVREEAYNTAPEIVD